MRVRARDWPVMGLQGLIGLVFGILVLIWPAITLQVLLYLFAAYVLVDGLLSLGSGLRIEAPRQRSWARVLRGCVEIVAALVTLFWPAITASVLLYIIALWAIITGLLQVVAAYQFREEIAGETLLAVAGVVSIVFGLLLFARPMAGALAMVTLIGVFGLIYGVLLLAFAFLLRGGATAAA